MAVMTKRTNREISQGRTPASGNVVERVSQILGYDIGETQVIERDRDLHDRVSSRLCTGDTVPASDVFGSTAE